MFKNIFGKRQQVTPPMKVAVDHGNRPASKVDPLAPDPSELHRLRYAILRYLFWAMLVGAFAAIGPAVVHKEPVAAVTVLLWAMACLTCGLLAGFLFAIPKVFQGYRTESEGMTGREVTADPNTRVEKSVSTSSRAELPYSLQVNTNLEQISDWLCKIIVGVGLIEMRRIPANLGELSRDLAADLGAGLTPSFAGGLIVYFAVIGFLFGYLGTRLLLAGEFGRADRDAVLGVARQEFRQEIDRRLKDQLDDLDVRIAVTNGRFVYSGEPPESGDVRSVLHALPHPW